MKPYESLIEIRQNLASLKRENGLSVEEPLEKNCLRSKVMKQLFVVYL